VRPLFGIGTRCATSVHALCAWSQNIRPVGEVGLCDAIVITATCAPVRFAIMRSLSSSVARSESTAASRTPRSA